VTATNRFVFVDIETTGLEVTRDELLEVGIVITDVYLNPIASFSTTVWDNNAAVRIAYMKHALDVGETMHGKNYFAWVYNQHTRSGLLAEASTMCVSPHEADGAIAKFLKHHGINKGDPMCGSSVHFDRSFLSRFCPQTEALFSYRNIDVSTIKELAKRWPRRGLEEYLKSHPAKKAHRALPDLEDSIEELKIYGSFYMGVMP
jgi:oligoribonuclease